MTHHHYHAEIGKHLEFAAQHLKSAAHHHFQAEHALHAGARQKAAFHSNIAVQHIIHAEDFQDQAMKICAQKNSEELFNLNQIISKKTLVHSPLTSHHP